MPLDMYDTTTPDVIPKDAAAVAGYTGGSWPTFPKLVVSFPNAHRLSIAPASRYKARCADVEKGDMTNDSAVAWFKSSNCDMSQGKPVLYTSLSNVMALVSTFARAGIPKSQYLVWSAHYTGKAHLCGPQCGLPFTADATQWWNRARNKNLDISLVSDGFFPSARPAHKPAYLKRLRQRLRYTQGLLRNKQLPAALTFQLQQYAAKLRAAIRNG